MFEPITQSLYEAMMFAIVGCGLALLYEPLRIGRLFFRTGAVMVGIQDFLFLAASAVVIFAYSLEFGAGYFRYFYVAGAVFGAAVYFLTAGRLISFVTRRFAGVIRAAAASAAGAVRRRVLSPLKRRVVEIAQKNKARVTKMYENVEKRKADLKLRVEMKYNSIKKTKAESRGKKPQGEVKHEQQEKKPIRARVTRVSR